MDGFGAMKHFQIGKNGLERLYKAVAERALDRISGERVGYLSPFYDRIDLAHARMYALSPAGGELPSRSLARETGEAAGLDSQDIRHLIHTIQAYERRSLVTDGQLVMQLESLGFSITADNLAKARSIATAAMAEAYLSAVSSSEAIKASMLGVPVPPAMAQFGSLTRVAPPGVPPGASLAEVPAAPAPTASDLPDAPFSEAAKIVIRRKVDEGLWDEGRAREVKASVQLFSGANGDISFSAVRQQHLFEWVGLMGRLPKRYNHFMVKGQGGFAAALSSVAVCDFESEEENATRLKKTGLHSGTRNKHLT